MNDNQSPANPVALVTGVSRRIGIGAAIVRRLSADGLRVMASGWPPHDDEMPWPSDPEGPDQLLKELRSHGAEVDWATVGRTLCLRIDGSHAEIQADRDDNDFFVIYNASPTEVRVAVAEPPAGKKWHRAIDTAQGAPNDFVPTGGSEPFTEAHYACVDRSVVLFLSR